MMAISWELSMEDYGFRVYLDPDEIGPDGYPYAWHGKPHSKSRPLTESLDSTLVITPKYSLKDLTRERDGNRCLRCHHPYAKGDGQWSRCDSQCTHLGPVRIREPYRRSPDWEDWGETVDLGMWGQPAGEAIYDQGPERMQERYEIEAEWRILTVHHLNGIKHDCRWWNLVSLCQRDHLMIQSAVVMERPYHGEHSEWFKPFAAAYYAWKYLGLDLQPAEVAARMDELLALEHQGTQGGLF